MIPTLLTRWQQLAVPGFHGAEDKAATRLVLEVGLAGIVMGADTGVPLVPRQAGTIATPILVDLTLCDRGKGSEKWVDCLENSSNYLMPAKPEGWVLGTIPRSQAPQSQPRIRHHLLSQGSKPRSACWAKASGAPALKSTPPVIGPLGLCQSLEDGDMEQDGEGLSDGRWGRSWATPTPTTTSR